ncbi:hypothetical protein BRC65_04910 [Halobacteriales archaeon QH_2_65_14]|nr:MAG: hypothetical protein BRC65_04910 [Halobacteriales archaeon QH_2_65_14]
MTHRSHTLVGAVVVHLFLTAAHGVAHVTIPVPVHDWQTGVATAVLFVVPILGAVLARSGRVRAGSWLVLTAGLGGLAFEGLLHFVVSNPDHVGLVTDGDALFLSTAVLTTLGDALLVLAGGWFLFARSRRAFPASVLGGTRQ